VRENLIMITLRRLRALTESYGADLRRWPPDLRDQAQELLSSSPEARGLFEDARRLDVAIDAASACEDGQRWQRGEQQAALARLRSGVAARILVEQRPPSLHARGPFARLLSGLGGASPGLRRAGLATSAVFAIIAGLLIGTTYGSAPAPAGVLSMLLRPAVLEILPD
jgi:hypothetical protein